MQLLTYSSLTGTSSARGTIVQVSEPGLHRLLRSILETVYVDEAWYCRTYGDVGEAVKQGKLRTAHDHYVQVGYFENRFPRDIQVDEHWYKASYGDVAQAIKRGSLENGQEHFEKEGFKEGRLPYEGWHLLEKKRDASVPDEPPVYEFETETTY